MPVEEQLLGSQFTSTPSSRRAGQRLTISGRVVTKLAFFLNRTGSLVGVYYFRIRKASDDSIIAEINMGATNAVATGAGAWYEGTFASPPLVNEEVYISQEVPAQAGGGNLGVWNSWSAGGDVKPGEVYSYGAWGWTDNPAYDFVYKYTYVLPEPPELSTQAADGQAEADATLHGTVTALNDTGITKRGFVWDVVSRADPGNVAPIDSDYAQCFVETGAFGLGAFSKAISGLHPGTTYYFRPAALNSSSQWAYGPELSFLQPGVATTEEQTLDLDTVWSSVTVGTGWGQRLTITNRWVTKLAFPLIRIGVPGGTVTFVIRRTSDDAVLASKLWGNADDIPLVKTWEEVTFDAKVFINEEVRIYVTSSAGGVGNLVQVYNEGWGAHVGSDVKANENAFSRNVAGVYTDWPDYDAPYIYTFFVGKPGLLPGALELMTPE